MKANIKSTKITFIYAKQTQEFLNLGFINFFMGKGGLSTKS